VPSTATAVYQGPPEGGRYDWPHPGPPEGGH